uniref:Secreted protein n=1 Tax=Steinernema glaseri TaxID=37863 RepID=A0A1I7YZI6_9BILA
MLLRDHQKGQPTIFWTFVSFDVMICGELGSTSACAHYNVSRLYSVSQLLDRQLIKGNVRRTQSHVLA